MNKIKVNKDKEILNFNQVFKVDKKLGEGAYGYVIKITNKFNNQSFALKVIKNADINTVREIGILIELTSYDYINKNVVRYYDYFFYNSYLCILTEYIEGETVSDYFKTKRSLSTWIKFARWLLTTISYLHNVNIVHRDIKPDNIIVTKNSYKLIDFGLSCQVNSKNNVLKCNQEKVWAKYFTAPEVYSNIYINYKANDNYAAGMTLYYIYSHHLPYLHNREGEIINPTYYPIPTLSNKLNFILKGLLSINPKYRLTSYQALTYLNN